jgi:6-phosphogluconolactonase (cycloisomerase 2 family)
VDPSGKFAYVVNSQSNSVSAFTIDLASGALTEVAGSPFAAGTGPNSLTVDQSSKFVFVTNASGNNVSAYTIGSTGALTPVAGSPFAAGSSPNSVKVDPTGKFAYVVNLGTPSQSISEYAIDPASGRLNSSRRGAHPWTSRVHDDE